MESATHRNHFMSPPTFAMSTATRNYSQTSSYFLPGQHFLETFMLLSYNNQDHTFMGDYIIPVLKQQTRPLLHLIAIISHSDIQQCLNVATHIPLRHLAAKIPSQLHNNFLSSFQRDLQHRGTLYSTLPLKLS